MRDFKKYHKKSLKKFGGKEKVRIFAARLRNNGKFIDNTEKDKDNEVKNKKEVKEILVCNLYLIFGVNQISNNQDLFRSVEIRDTIS